MVFLVIPSFVAGYIVGICFAVLADEWDSIL